MRWREWTISRWATILALAARERPGRAAGAAVGVAVALPPAMVLTTIALVVAVTAVVVVAVPLSIVTAVWWIVEGRRGRPTTTRAAVAAAAQLSWRTNDGREDATVGRGDAERTDAGKGRRARTSEVSRSEERFVRGQRASSPGEGLQGASRMTTGRDGDSRAAVAGRTAPAGGSASVTHSTGAHADLLIVHAGQREFCMEGCDDAGRMVADRVAARVSAATSGARTVACLDVAELSGVGRDGEGVVEMLLGGREGLTRPVCFVVESAVCTEEPSDDLRKLRRMLAAAAERTPAPLTGLRFVVIAVSRSVAPEGDKWCGPRVGGEAGARFETFVASLAGGADARLAPRCDAEIEHNGPGVVDRWATEVLAPALDGKPPTPPRVLCLSSSHTALLCRHLNGRHLLVGCDAFFDEEYDGGGGGGGGESPRGSPRDRDRRDGSPSHAETRRKPIPRVNPWAPNLDRVAQLRPTLVICAYQASADALRVLSPKWEDPEARKGSFEVAVLPCPIGKNAVAAAAAQFSEVARLARVSLDDAGRAAKALTEGLAALRLCAERELADESDSVTWRRRPWIFIEADPELYSADSWTPLGAALAEGLGVGNIADPPLPGEENGIDGGGGSLTARAQAALEKKRHPTPPPSHYPQLPAQRFWQPREPDWWIIGHPTSGSGKSYSDQLDPEDVKRHGALREGRMVRLSDSLCHAGSQWTPELVDVVRAVLDAMVSYQSGRKGGWQVGQGKAALKEGKEKGEGTGKKGDAIANPPVAPEAISEPSASSNSEASATLGGGEVGKGGGKGGKKKRGGKKK